MRAERSGVSQSIARGLRREIITGKRAPGAPLRQDQIAAEYRASHVPVREALQALQSEGLVLYLPRKGASVAPISRADILDVIDMRTELEGLAFRRALENGEAEAFDRDGAGAQITASENSDDPDIWVAANWAFHRLLYAACQRPRLIQAIEELWLPSERYLRMVWERLDWQMRSQTEHKELLALAANNDIEGAVRLLKHHIRSAGQGLLALLTDLQTH
ncbi:MAG TPA: GntR family transcriptional regulator [Desulfobacteraceae bacterium]|nr:GntR family transcriptional regulator [Desulfobacteraceae bacterium]